MRRIVLASASPRRKALLEQIGLAFTVDGDVREDVMPAQGEPQHLAREASLRKARSVAGKHPNSIIIAADTIGFIDGRILGKPHSPDKVRAILRSISGRRHGVITGFTVLDTGTGKSVTRSVETAVDIKRLTPAEIDAYVKTGEPLDKAGAYAIQGRGAAIVERIEGDYTNVVGLPLCALAEALKEFGVSIL